MTGLRRAAVIEAMTLLALFCIAMPLKYWAGLQVAVSVVGPVHGLAFMVFLWFIMRALGEGLINLFGALRLFVGALIPFGGFVNERWLKSLDQGTTDAV